MSTDDQPSVWPQPLRKSLQDLALQLWREIGESQIAAQNEIEKAWDSVGAQIVMHERDAATMPFEDAEQMITFFETPRDQIGRQFAKRRHRVAAVTSPCEHGIVYICRNDRQASGGTGFQIPQKPERVGLLARGTARRPALGVALLVPRPLRDPRKDTIAEYLEHPPVAKEA